MPASAPTILATSGGWIPDRRRFVRPGPLMDFALELAAPRRTPRWCAINTAGGDQSIWQARVHEAFYDRDVVVTCLSLFPMPNVDDVRAHLLAQDVIWVGGGSVANLLAVWQVHGLGETLRECWESGVVLAGVSAGSICWHVGGTTDSFGPELRPISNGLAFLPYSNGVHYDSEAQRRPLFQSLVADGTLPDGYATDDGVGLYYRGTTLVEAVAERDDVAAYQVVRRDDGTAHESVITPRRLSPGR